MQDGPLRAVAALLLCAALALPSAAAETASVAPSAGGDAAPSAPAAPHTLATGTESLRVPDASALSDTPDLPVLAPHAGPTPLALPGNWTLLVYMVADNDLESFAIQDLNEMEAAAASSAVRVVVEVDRSSRYDTSNGDWTGTRRYLIGHDSDASTVTSALLADLGELNMGDPQNLADFLVWGVDAYPAAHYLVDLWDHGYGWSGGFGNDLGDNDHLSIAEIGAALRALDEHLGRPVDLLAFDACLMQQMEVAYEFAWLADFLVAGQDLEPAAGWPYDEMLSPILADPALAPEAVARSLVDAYLGYYGLQGEAMMSATRLADIRTGLADTLNALALQLAASVEEPQKAPEASVERAIWDARTLAPAMFNVDYVDLGQFLRGLSQDARLTDAMRQAAARALNATQASIVEEGHSVYKAGLTGMSVYLPAFSLPSRYLQTRFANESYWDEFVVALLSGVPQGGPAPTAQVLAPPEGGRVARRFTASLSAAAAAGEGLRLEYKSGWGNYTRVAEGLAPLEASPTLDAGRDAGSAVLTFRAVDTSGRPSASVERHVSVVATPVTLEPPLPEFALAINRTKSVLLTATPRPPYQDFSIGWQGLPAGVSGAGTTSSVNASASPAPPFPLTLVLTADSSAREGAYAVTLAVRPASEPSVATFLEIALTLTRALPDLAVTPLVLSSELPLPGDLVTASANISNLGFENVSTARIVAEFVDGSGNRTELANLTVGPLAPGEGTNLSVGFTASRGTQRIAVRATPEPAVEELSVANNERARTLTIVNLSVALEAPVLPVQAPLGGGTTPVAIVVRNLGTDADRYDLLAANLSNGSWQVGLSASSVPVPGRASGSVLVDVLPPLTAEGGDEISFTLEAHSNADANVSASLNITVRAVELFGATVRPTPNDLELAAGGADNVTVQLQNTGNGHESFALVLQDGDERLHASLDISSFVLGPGSGATARLALSDGGLVATDRPYSLEVVAVSLTSGLRFTSIVSIRVAPVPAAAVEPLEPRIEVPAAGNVSFHARVRNAGNTNLLLAFSAAALSPALEVHVTEPGALLEPGASTVVNGSAQFSAPPLAGTFGVTVRASAVKGALNASATFALVVAVTHGLSAHLGDASTAGPRAVVRTLTVENRGNAPENVSLVVGYVPVGLRLTVDPPTDPLAVPARGNASLRLTLEGPASQAASGEILIILRAQPGGPSVAVNVSYDFAALPPSPVPLVVTGLAIAAAAAVVAWAFWPMRRQPKEPPQGQ